MTMFPDDFSDGSANKAVKNEEKALLHAMKQMSDSTWYKKIFGGSAKEEVGRNKNTNPPQLELTPGHALDDELTELDNAFYHEFKYRWDAVMVLPVHSDLRAHCNKMFHEAHPTAPHGFVMDALASVTGHHHVKIPQNLIIRVPQRIIQALRCKNIETHQFYSAHHDRIFVKVRATPRVLREHADKLDFPMELDPKEVEDACKRGVEGELVGGKKVFIKPFEISGGDDDHITSIKPYDPIYAKMDDQIFNATPKLYKEYRNLGHAFGPVTRLRILDSLVKEAFEDGLDKIKDDMGPEDWNEHIENIKSTRLIQN